MTIKEAREAAGLSRSEMEKLFGIPHRTLQDWEYGKRQTPPWAEKLIIKKLEDMAMKKAVNIYRNYGVLGAEKRNVYTYGNPQPTAATWDVITVAVPDGWDTYHNAAGDMLLQSPDGTVYTPNEILAGNDKPCFSYIGKDGKKKQIELEILAE